MRLKLYRIANYLLIILIVTACSTQKKLPQPSIPDSATKVQYEAGLLKVDYDGFSLWLDCKERAAVKFRYNAQQDMGNQPRKESFNFDPDVPRRCQQISTKSYGNYYDRGHQVPANHLDYSAIAIKQSNYITNILPQAAAMNRGAWLLTEEIIECYRDIDDLLVLGGVIWGNDADNDYFIASHGVRTPDAFWKVVIRGKEDAIAWIIPNNQEASRNKLDDYLTTVANIELITGEKFFVSDNIRNKKLKYSWILPIGCNKD